MVLGQPDDVVAQFLGQLRLSQRLFDNVEITVGRLTLWE
jgi:hypothetical protein